MKVSHVYESIDESDARKPTKEEHITLLERKKRSLLHELKILSVQMHDWIEAGVVSQMSEADKYPNHVAIPDSTTRRILTTNLILQQKVLNTFARFSTAKEILSNSVMPELEALQKEGEEKKS